MTVTTLQTILLTALIAIWLIFSIVILISSIQNFFNDRKREKRNAALEAEREERNAKWEAERQQLERERAIRDAEYHEARMKELGRQ
jgi:beta-lactamase regulating signal transducer with metallopeptidase domain